MTIRRITVTFVGKDGAAQAEVTGSVDRRAELVRQARERLEKWKTAARREGDPRASEHFELLITDAPASPTWPPS